MNLTSLIIIIVFFVLPVVFLIYSFVYLPLLEKWLRAKGKCINAKIIKIENAYGKDIIELYAQQKTVSNDFDIYKFCAQSMIEKKTHYIRSGEIGESGRRGYSAEVFCEYNGIMFKDSLMLRETLATILQSNIKTLRVYYNPNFPKQCIIDFNELDNKEDFGSLGEDAVD